MFALVLRRITGSLPGLPAEPRPAPEQPAANPGYWVAMKQAMDAQQRAEQILQAYTTAEPVRPELGGLLHDQGRS